MIELGSTLVAKEVTAEVITSALLNPTGVMNQRPPPAVAHSPAC